MQKSLLLALAFFVQTPSPASNDGAIAGQVRLNDGSPAVGYRVEVVDVRDSWRGVIASFETNGFGRFRIDAVPAGRYYLRVQSQRFPHPAYYPGVWSPAQAEAVTVEPGRLLGDLTLPASDSVSLGELSCFDSDGKCFDFERRIVVEGVVKEFKNRGPRLSAVLMIRDELGPRNLDLSGPSGAIVLSSGGQMKAGDRVTVVVSPRLDGGPGAFLVGFADPNGIDVSVWGSGTAFARSTLPSLPSNLPPRPTVPPFAPGIPIRINFQPMNTQTPAGYLTDTGEVSGAQGNGYRYGWAQPNYSAQIRHDRAVLGTPYDSLTRLQGFGIDHVWEMEVPNGFYSVHVVAGDPDNIDSVYVLSVEGVIAINGIPSSANRWLEADVRVAVADGRLTVANGPGARNNKISFIEITPVASGPVSPDAKPPVAAQPDR